MPLALVRTLTALLEVSILVSPRGVEAHRFGESNNKSWTKLDGIPSVVVNGLIQSFVCSDHRPIPPLVAM